MESCSQVLSISELIMPMKKSSFEIAQSGTNFEQIHRLPELSLDCGLLYDIETTITTLTETIKCYSTF